MSTDNPHFADMPPADRHGDIPENKGAYRFAGAWTYPATGNVPPLLKARYDGPVDQKTGKPKKTMLWLHGKADDVWVFGLQDKATKQTHKAGLYGLQSVRPGESCFIVEGEKAAAALHSIGAAAVGLPGKDSAASVDLSPLDGLDVILWADNDPETPERKNGADAMNALAERLARAHRRVDPDVLDLPDKGDAADLVNMGDVPDSAALWKLLDGAMQDVPAPPPTEPMGEHLPDDWLTASIPPREFVFRGALPLDAVSLLVATGGTGKSMLSLELAASVATGRTLLSCFEPTAGPSRVAVLALEDDIQEVQRRLQRVARAFSLEYDTRDVLAVARNVRFFCLPAFAVCAVARDGMLAESPDLKRLADELAEFRPRLVIADPLAGLLGGVVEEGSNEAAQAVIGLLRAAMPPGAALLVCAHTSKAERMLSTTARGASAWMDASRQVLALRPPDTKDETKNLGDDARITVVLEMTKSNYSALAPPVYLQRCIEPQFAGVLKPINYAECKQRALQERMAGIADVVLQALRECPVTMQEAWPKGNKEAIERGDAFIVALNIRAGRNVTRIDRLACLKSMCDDGRIAKVKDGRREVLAPVLVSEMDEDCQL